MYRVIAIATALLTIGFVAVPNDANAEVAGPAMTQRHATNLASKQLAMDIKQARIDRARKDMGGAKTFIVNGRRVLVPSDSNAEAVIRALKARYPGLQADTREARSITALEEK